MSLPRTCPILVLVGLTSCGRAPPESTPAPSDSSPSMVTADEPDREMLAKLESDSFNVIHENAGRIVKDGNAATRRAAGPLLVRAARGMSSEAWRARERQVLAKNNDAAPAGSRVTDAVLEVQLDELQRGAIFSVMEPMGSLGGDEVTAFLLETAEDTHALPGVQRMAVDLLLDHPPSDPAAANRLHAAALAASSRPLLTRATPLGEAAAERKATVMAGQVDATGGEVHDAARIIDGLQGDFRRCYVRALQQDGASAGTIRVTAELDAHGVVTSATHQAMGHVAEGFEKCVADRILTAMFPEPRSGPSRLVIPLTFTLRPD